MCGFFYKYHNCIKYFVGKEHNVSYFVYIIWSEKNKKHYIGQTADVENRLMEHNSGKSRSTKFGKPWLLEYTEEYATRSEAVKRERFLKSSTGWKQLKEIYLNSTRTEIP
ncbi:MAG: GIY-YIG nuclease family protein [Ignavibacteriales bacterium]|nr:GIY-YIG nuclease family protein [Ignavibacteriales bacterium]